MNESCVETPAAPDWLSKLESRREKLGKRRLGHESGAGAPCLVCGEKCPGLDLHFWRKVCRNCKCRKEQHECADDDFSGWAQFEILGQIRSKPAYINISMFKMEPVKLDWVPPNAATDLVNDYMTDLGTTHIPVAGSDAAARRKQQLEFQVPAHDLDPNLCDDLTAKEEEQLNQYASKIKENCVGQGALVRIEPVSSHVPEVQGNLQKDKLAAFILNSEAINGAMQSYAVPYGKLPQTISSPLIPDFHQSPILTDKVKYKLNLMNINSQAIQSGTINGPFYDEVLSNLHRQHVNFEADNLLKPMDDFRQEYLKNDNFQSNVNQFVGSMGNRFLDTIPELDEPPPVPTFKPPHPVGLHHMYNTPQKGQSSAITFNSPLPFRAPYGMTKEGRLVQQETPMRKAKFTPMADRVLSDVLQRVKQYPMPLKKVPLRADWEESPHLSPTTKAKLRPMNINSDAIKSAVNNPQDYDRIFKALKSQGDDYSGDAVLAPIEKLQNAMKNDGDLRRDVEQFVQNSDRSNVSTPVPDRVLSNVLQRAKQYPMPLKKIPMRPDWEESPYLSPASKSKLRDMNINSDAIKSAVNNPQEYDKIFRALQNQGEDYSGDAVLAPIEKLQNAMKNDGDLRRDVEQFVQNSDRSNVSTPVPDRVLSDVLQRAKQYPMPLKKIPMRPDWEESPYLSPASKSKLRDMNINSDAIKSAVNNPQEYDKIFRALQNQGEDYSGDAVLAPIEKLQNAMKNDGDLLRDVEQFVHNSDRSNVSTPVPDRVLSDVLQRAKQYPMPLKKIPMRPDWEESPYLSPASKSKLRDMNINSDAIKSAVNNPQEYDQIFRALQNQGEDYSGDAVLAPIEKLQNAMKNDGDLRRDVEQFVQNSDRSNVLTPVPDRVLSDVLQRAKQYPMPLKKIPMRPDWEESPYLSPASKSKLRDMNINSDAIKSAVNNPQEYDQIFRALQNQGEDYSGDAVLAPIEKLQNAMKNDGDLRRDVEQFVQNSDRSNVSTPVPDRVLSDVLQRAKQYPMPLKKIPMRPDWEESPYLSPATKSKLRDMNINSDAIKSAVNNPQEYDQIFRALQNQGEDYSGDAVLAPIEKLQNAMRNDGDLRRDVEQFIQNSDNSNAIPGSKSTDSGFDSQPPTPNYGTYPGISDLNATQGKMMGIPGIADMNMYPMVKPQQSTVDPRVAELEKMKDLQIGNPNQLPTSGGDVRIATKCNQCLGPIHPGDVAIKADRAGKDVAWHPKCFVCFKCNELLADLVYFFHGGHVYCARDLAVILKIPRCHACDELIFTKEYTAAEGRTFHIKHFCCYQCDSPLAGQQYLPDEKTNMPLCLKCYNQFHAEMCQACKKVIGPAEQGVQWGQIHWHSTCFVCFGKECGKSLIGGRFCVKNDMPFCSAPCVKSIIS